LNSNIKTLAIDGLWKNNPGLIQLLGLCPLLAVSNTLINALGLGLATLFVLLCSNSAIALIGRFIPAYLRLPIFVLIIASLVTMVQMLLAAYRFSLYESLGIFLALITTNCVILGRAEAYAAKNPVRFAIVDGLMQGLGFLLVLLLLGSLRELIGQGSLLHDAQALFGPTASNWAVYFSKDQSGFLLALFPPGAFILLGCLVALHNVTRGEK
jgi:electron transport complex protein RnfE